MSLKTVSIDEILEISEYEERINYFNLLLSNIDTLFRKKYSFRHGREHVEKSYIELAREYLNLLSAMTHRLSVLVIESDRRGIFHKRVEIVLNNITKVERKLRNLVRAEIIWLKHHSWALRFEEIPYPSPIPSEAETYWTNVIKAALDKTNHDVNNLIQTAYSLGGFLKVNIEVLQDLKSKHPYNPQLVSYSEAQKIAKTQQDLALGETG
jgi:hypothetical protein